MVWYDFAKPVHPQLHSDYLLHLAEVKARSKNRIRAIRHLVQNLRLVKSAAEIERMKIAGKVTSQVRDKAVVPKRMLTENLAWCRNTFQRGDGMWTYLGCFWLDGSGDCSFING